MNPMIAMFILRVAEIFINPAVRAEVKDINDAVDVLVAELNATNLSKKDDGTDWTREDVLAMRDQLAQTNQEIRDLAKPSAAGD